MAWQEQVSVKSVLVESIDDLRAPVPNADIEITQLKAGYVTGELTRVVLGDIAFSIGSFSNPIRAAGVFSRTHTTVGALLDGSENNFVWGSESAPGSMMWTPPGGDHDIRYTGRASFVGLSIRPNHLAELLANEAWLGDEETWTKKARCHPNSQEQLAQGHQLKDLAASISRHDGQIPPATKDFWTRCVVDLFVAGMLGTLPQSAEVIPSATRIVREVEFYLESQKFRPVHISEICSMLNVSRRTLTRIFCEVTGMGPAAFLRRKRLCKIHSELLRGEPATGRITHLATEFGFAELGRFSQYYKALFGEQPSETLRRRRRN